MVEAPEGRQGAGLSSDWLKSGATKDAVLKEAAEGTKILARLSKILKDKFQEQAEKDYDIKATDRELAYAAGYRKCLKDVFRLVQLDN